MAFGAGFFAAVGFVVDLAAAVLVADFFDLAVDVPNLMPADLAMACNLALRREAVFFFSKSFLTALSYSD